MKNLKLSAILLLSAWSTIPYAQTLFYDDFESGLSKWTAKAGRTPTAKTVNDPLNSGRGKVLTFTKKVIEGDIFSKAIISNSAANKPYILEFDYLGKPANAKKKGNGGYIGYSRNSNPGPGSKNHRWVGGTQSGYAIYRGDQYQTLSDKGQWSRYRVDLSATDFPDFMLMLEDYLHAGGVAGDAYFDNIVLTDARGPTYHRLSVTKAGVGSGKINSVPKGINCGADCTHDYTEGDRITLTAIPDAKSTFAGWSGDCGTKDNATSIMLNSAKSCTAVFSKIERCEVLPKANVGMTFSAKFPDKPGKYYIVPADAASACLKLIESSTVLIIDQVQACGK